METRIRTASLIVRMLLHRFVRCIPSLPRSPSLFLEERVPKGVEIYSLQAEPTPPGESNLRAASAAAQGVPSIA